MIRTTLESILGRHKSSTPIIRRLLDSFGTNLLVQDSDGHPLLEAHPSGPADSNGLVKSPIAVEGDQLGFVSGPASSAESVAATLGCLVAKESEIRRLSAEVLNMYREINLIHRFSETLATVLDAPAVAKASIEQALHMVKGSFAAIVLLNEKSGAFEPIASQPPEAAGKFSATEGLIGAIASTGIPEIVNEVSNDPRRGAGDLALCSVICVPLKLKETVCGILVVGSEEPVAYAARDLKLLTTLALLTTTAIENAILHERTLEAARVEVLQRTLQQVEEQKHKAEAMLLNILPASVARDLQRDGFVEPMYFEDVTVCFTDFVGFSRSTTLMAAEEVVQELNRYFTAFDQIAQQYGVEKLKTIGDSYMFASGLPTRRPANPIDAVLAALEIVEAVRHLSSDSKADWKIRVGLHTGPVIAGVVGIRKFAFDIWGETVNLASRMESCGEPNRVNISERTYARVKDFFIAEPRGRIKTKEGQDIDMYFVDGICPPPLFEKRYRLYFRDSMPAFPEHLRIPRSC